jgi:hypothetical protein
MNHVLDNYKPPHFSVGNANNKYFFTTHSMKETQEKKGIGSLKTPYHRQVFLSTATLFC